MINFIAEKISSRYKKLLEKDIERQLEEDRSGVSYQIMVTGKTVPVSSYYTSNINICNVATVGCNNGSSGFHGTSGHYGTSGPLIDYANYIADQLNNNIQYTEYVASQLDRSISYAEYIAEQLDRNNLNFNDYNLRFEGVNRNIGLGGALQPKNKNIKRIYSDVDPYGEENWEDD